MVVTNNLPDLSARSLSRCSPALRPNRHPPPLLLFRHSRNSQHSRHSINPLHSKVERPNAAQQKKAKGSPSLLRNRKDGKIGSNPARARVRARNKLSSSSIPPTSSPPTNPQLSHTSCALLLSYPSISPAAHLHHQKRISRIAPYALLSRSLTSQQTRFPTPHVHLHFSFLRPLLAFFPHSTTAAMNPQEASNLPPSTGNRNRRTGKKVATASTLKAGESSSCNRAFPHHSHPDPSMKARSLHHSPALPDHPLPPTLAPDSSPAGPVQSLLSTPVPNSLPARRGQPPPRTCSSPEGWLARMMVMILPKAKTEQGK
jgi:hypothetical protein